MRNADVRGARVQQNSRPRSWEEAFGQLGKGLERFVEHEERADETVSGLLRLAIAKCCRLRGCLRKPSFPCPRAERGGRKRGPAASSVIPQAWIQASRRSNA